MAALRHLRGRHHQPDHPREGRQGVQHRGAHGAGEGGTGVRRRAGVPGADLGQDQRRDVEERHRTREVRPGRHRGQGARHVRGYQSRQRAGDGRDQGHDHGRVRLAPGRARGGGGCELRGTVPRQDERRREGRVRHHRRDAEDGGQAGQRHEDPGGEREERRGYRQARGRGVRYVHHQRQGCGGHVRGSADQPGDAGL